MKKHIALLPERAMNRGNKKTHTSIDLNNELQKALEYHQAGRLQMAEVIYRKILVINPNHSDALNLLGIIAHQTGRYEIAIDLMSKAIRNNPQVPFYYNNIGGVFTSQGWPEEAVVHYRKAIQLKPDYAEAYYNLGNIFKDLGKTGEAISHYQKAIELKPDYAFAYNNMGIILHNMGRLEEAIDHYHMAIRLQSDYAEAYYNSGIAFREKLEVEKAVSACQKAIQLKPDYVDAHYSLGALFKNMKQSEKAIAHYEKAIELKPDYAEAYYNLGFILQYDVGKIEEAIVHYQKAIELNPDYAEVYNDMGNALQSQGKTEDAISCYQRAFTAEPNFVEARINLGNAFKELGRIDEAISLFQWVLNMRPDLPEVHNNLGIALQSQGAIEEAIMHFQRALHLNPDYMEAHSNYLMALHYDTRSDKEALFKETIKWSEKYCFSLDTDKCFSNIVDPERKIKIGYVSGDFRIHPVGFFIEAVLVNHSRERFEIYCYYNNHKNDDITGRYQSLPLYWRNIAGISDEEVEKMIIKDGIDILIDLSGHSAKHRLLLFARKPAPIQATWIGYFDTTGMKAMDYVIADKYIIPEEDEIYYVEKIVRLPDCYLCYTPHAYAQEVNELPCLSQGYITFGCFNNIAKINPTVVAVWSEILQAVPGSRLCLGTQSFNSPSIRNEYMEQFAGNGVEPDRIVFLGKLPHLEYLAYYENIDIVLETFPFTGNTTTVDALWMGVPVVTLVQDSFVGRLGLSILATLNLNDLIAFTKDDYIRKVLSLAGDIEGLSALRRSLRERLSSSPLCNGMKFTSDMENIYRAAWRKWCERQIVTG
jgi:protein O-GlcNAc transferase